MLMLANRTTDGKRTGTLALPGGIPNTAGVTPQQYATPSASSAHVCASPAPTARTTGGTITGGGPVLSRHAAAIATATAPTPRRPARVKSGIITYV
ncbi:MAG: hypothetical protein NVS4B3_19120 [Gemmatimonadaceae bacterium]